MTSETFYNRILSMKKNEIGISEAATIAKYLFDELKVDDDAHMTTTHSIPLPLRARKILDSFSKSLQTKPPGHPTRLY